MSKATQITNVLRFIHIVASKITCIHSSGGKSTSPCTSRPKHVPTMKPATDQSAVWPTYIVLLHHPCATLTCSVRNRLQSSESVSETQHHRTRGKCDLHQLIRHIAPHRPYQISPPRSSTQHHHCQVRVPLMLRVARLHALQLSSCPNRQPGRNQYERRTQTPGNKGKTQVSNAAPKHHNLHA